MKLLQLLVYYKIALEVDSNDALSVQQFQVQVAPRLIGESLKEFACQPESEYA